MNNSSSAAQHEATGWARLFRLNRLICLLWRRNSLWGIRAPIKTHHQPVDVYIWGVCVFVGIHAQEHRTAPLHADLENWFHKSIVFHFLLLELFAFNGIQSRLQWDSCWLRPPCGMGGCGTTCRCAEWTLCNFPKAFLSSQLQPKCILTSLIHAEECKTTSIIQRHDNKGLIFRIFEQRTRAMHRHKEESNNTAEMFILASSFCLLFSPESRFS